MKKVLIALLVLVMALSLVACRRRNNDVETTPTTTPQTSEMPFIPDMDPTLDTNIPDPSVDTQMPIYTDGTDPTNHAANSRSGR